LLPAQKRAFGGWCGAFSSLSKQHPALYPCIFENESKEIVVDEYIG